MSLRIYQNESFDIAGANRARLCSNSGDTSSYQQTPAPPGLTSQTSQSLVRHDGLPQAVHTSTHCFPMQYNPDGSWQIYSNASTLSASCIRVDWGGGTNRSRICSFDSSSHDASSSLQAFPIVQSRQFPDDSEPVTHNAKAQVRPSSQFQCWEHGCNGRSFSSFSNLSRHQREKSGAAPKFTCPECGSAFTRSTARNVHIARGGCKACKDSDHEGQNRYKLLQTTN